MLETMDNKYSTTIERSAKTSNKKDILQNKEKELAKDNKHSKEIGNTYNGKRFLGLNKNGTPVFAMLTLKKRNTKLEIKFTHKLSSLLHPEAKLANDRYTYSMLEPLPKNYGTLVQKLKKKRNTEVTIRTLNYLTRLKLLQEVKYVKAFVNGKCTKYFFMTVANTIYAGSGFKNKSLVMKYWDFPNNNNEYFLPENTWKYPDEIL